MEDVRRVSYKRQNREDTSIRVTRTHAYILTRSQKEKEKIYILRMH